MRILKAKTLVYAAANVRMSYTLSGVEDDKGNSEGTVYPHTVETLKTVCEGLAGDRQKTPWQARTFG